jgi:cytochrome c oxidase assembly protein subunit 15
VLPPFSEDHWLAEFEKYRAIPQFLLVNPGMTLAEFRVIYWWEWTHRLLGRLIGAVFIVPFLVFLWRGRLVDRALAWKLGGIFLLGGVQGAIGWWMVQSGLADRVDVSPYRLAIHLTLACAILAAVVAIASALHPARKRPVPSRIRKIGALVLALVFVQIFLGALVAKTGAGRTFDSWPRIDGRFIPPADQLFAITPVWRNFFENALTVQFNHRMAAYLLFALAAWHAFDSQRTGPVPVALSAAVLFALTTAQAMLGVLTLLHQAPAGLALAHQAGAITLLLVATLHLAALSREVGKT